VSKPTAAYVSVAVSPFGTSRARSTQSGSRAAAQALNAFLPPLVIGFLIALALSALPPPLRPRGLCLWTPISLATIVIAVGLYGGLAGLP
jgi:hypothetical protein